MRQRTTERVAEESCITEGVAEEGSTTEGVAEESCITEGVAEEGSITEGVAEGQDIGCGGRLLASYGRRRGAASAAGGACSLQEG